MITLEKTCVVRAVHKKSSSVAFKKLNTGDLIRFSIPLKPVGTGGNGTYAAYVTCENLQTGETSRLSFNQLPATLALFELEEMLDVKEEA